MAVSKLVKKYIEMAVREKLARECPGYGKDTVERVVSASMNGLHVTKNVLYRAIELASEQAQGEGE